MIIEMIQGGGKLEMGYDAVPLELWSVEANYLLPEAGPAPGRITVNFDGGQSYEVTSTSQSFQGSGQSVVFSWEIGQADTFTIHYSIPVLQIDRWHISVAQDGGSIQILQVPDGTVTYKLYADVTFSEVSADVSVQQDGGASSPLEAGENHVYLTTAIALIVVEKLTVTAEPGLLTIAVDVVPES